MTTPITIEFKADTKDALKGIDDVSGALGKDLPQSTKKAGMSLTDIKAGIDIASQAFGMMQQALDATVGKAAAWGDEMGDLAQLTGSTVKETSAMAATFELMGVSTGTLEQAMKSMTKQGLQLNMDTLKKLSAEYKAIQDPVARNEFLFKKFGKAGMEMAEIMGRDTAELERLGAAAAVSGKVIDENAANAAENFNIELSILKQKSEGAAIAIGNVLIPTLTDAIEGGNNYAKTWGIVNLVMQKNIGVIDQEQLELRATALQAGDLGAVFTEQMVPALEDVTRATDDLYVATVMHGTALDTHKGKLEDDTNAYLLNKEAARGLKDMTAEYTAITGQAVDNELQSYQDKQRDIGGQIADTKTKLELLGKTPHLTPEQKAEMAELSEKLDKEKQQYADNAEAHNLATRKIILGYLEQQLAADGLSKAEIGYLLDIGTQWGIYGEDTKKIWDATVETIKGGALDADATMSALGARFPSYFSDINRSINYNVNVNGTVPYGAEPPGGIGGSGNAYSGGTDTGGTYGGAQAAGGDYWVTSPTWFLAGEAGPERATFTPQGQNTMMGNVTINVSGAGNPQAVAAAVRAELDRMGRSADTRMRTR